MRPIQYPAKLNWHLRGPVTESEQKLLRAEGLRQQSILKKDLLFQNLTQGVRVRVIGNHLFKCKSIFGIDTVDIALLVSKDKREIVNVLKCICTLQCAEGKILEIVPSEPFTFYPFTITDLDLAHIMHQEQNSRWSYNPVYTEGKRYVVKVCGANNSFQICVCYPTDFSTFSVSDNVVVIYNEVFPSVVRDFHEFWPYEWCFWRGSGWNLESGHAVSACDAPVLPDLPSGYNAPEYPGQSQFSILPYLVQKE